MRRHRVTEDAWSRARWRGIADANASPQGVGRIQLQAIHDLNAALTTASSAGRIYDLALDALWQTIAPDRASILLFDPDGVMRFKAWRGLSPEYRGATEGHSPWTADTVDPEPVLVEDVLTEPSLASLRDVIVGEGIRALAFVPLLSQGRLVGKFMLYVSRPHRFSDEEVWLARVIGAHVTFALDRRRAEEQLLFQKTLLELQSEASIEGILVVSNEGRMISFNRRFVDMWQIPEDVVASRSDAAAIEAVRDRLADPDEFVQRITYLYEHPDEESRDEIRLRDGRTFDRYSGPIRAGSGPPLGRAWFFHDVTVERREEQEQRFLAAAGEIVSSSLDHETTLRQVAELAVSEVADLVVVYLAQPDGSFRCLRIGRAPDADGLPPSEDRAHRDRLPPAVLGVLAGRRARLVEALDEASLAVLAGTGAGWRGVVRPSATIAPLIARDVILGALVTVGAATRPPFDGRDLRFAEELARRAATAVDNSLLHAAERRARELAQQNANRSARLQAVTAGLSRAVTAAEVASLVVTETVSALGADAGIVYALDDETRSFAALASAGYDRAVVEEWGRFSSDMPGPARDAVESRSLVVVRSGRAFADRWPMLARERPPTGDEASMTAPLVVRGHVRGVLHVAFRGSRSLTDEDRAFFSTLARQCSQALDRARLYEAEHRAAVTLQRSLLPGQLPEVSGIALAARYVAGGAGAQVGGDWYDAIPLDGRLTLVVGDVEGRGIGAASKMGQLRTALRAYALHEPRPGVLLERLNGFAHGLGVAPFATIACIALDPSTGEILLANAGHPPPLAIDPDGSARLVDVPLCPPIGAVPEAVYPERAIRLAPGGTVVLYTDGLVERRRVALTDGLARLRDVAERFRGDPGELLDRILEEMAGTEQADDIAMLAVSREEARPELFRRIPVDPHALAGLRHDLRAWLGIAGVDEEAIQAILVASGEALTNALEHPVGRRDGHVEVEGRLSHGTVSLVVRDSGTWRPPQDRPDRGRGLLLMNAFMDAVDVVPSEAGTEVRMRRRVERDVLAASGTVEPPMS